MQIEKNEKSIIAGPNICYRLKNYHHHHKIYRIRHNCLFLNLPGVVGPHIFFANSFISSSSVVYILVPALVF
jgi:hypothetical protein